MITGTVSHVSGRGFSFIRRDDGQEDIFCGANSLARSGVAELKKGQRVEFDTQPTNRGTDEAINVRIIAEAA
jgi:cold shock protein